MPSSWEYRGLLEVDPKLCCQPILACQPVEKRVGWYFGVSYDRVRRCPVRDGYTVPLQPRGEPLLAPRSLIRAAVRSEQALDILPEAISSASTFTLSYLLSPNLLNPCVSLAPPNKGFEPHTLLLRKALL